ncbi:Hypothetical predicted protein [Octopus vulgaris]|uniref:Uncharacterized protein n=1 Tax=Octopus vulgaris TaxID=6645 RepID=A0AA36B8Z7_OCTVU|nr:Hypothetical predicted protein [Octopus vulgaris]
MMARVAEFCCGGDSGEGGGNGFGKSGGCVDAVVVIDFNDDIREICYCSILIGCYLKKTLFKIECRSCLIPSYFVRQNSSVTGARSLYINLLLSNAAILLALTLDTNPPYH